MLEQDVTQHLIFRCVPQVHVSQRNELLPFRDFIVSSFLVFNQSTMPKSNSS